MLPTWIPLLSATPCLRTSRQMVWSTPPISTEKVGYPKVWGSQVGSVGVPNFARISSRVMLSRSPLERGSTRFRPGFAGGVAQKIASIASAVVSMAPQASATGFPGARFELQAPPVGPLEEKGVDGGPSEKARWQDACRRCRVRRSGKLLLPARVDRKENGSQAIFPTQDHVQIEICAVHILIGVIGDRLKIAEANPSVVRCSGLIKRKVVLFLPEQLRVRLKRQLGGDHQLLPQGQ